MTSLQPTALVIDDDASLATLYQLALEMAGFYVEQLNDSTLALPKILEMMPDVVMLDMQMPHVSGVDVLRAIRAEARLESVKVIMVTANTQVTYDETVNTLADLLLLKPVALRQIVDLASRLTQTKVEQNVENLQNSPQ